MPDSIVLKMPRGMADKTGLDPANSGTAGTNGKARYYVTGPPTNGGVRQQGVWQIQGWGTQTNSNSVTAGTYAFVRDENYYTVSPTSYNYVPNGT